MSSNTPKRVAPRARIISPALIRPIDSACESPKRIPTKSIDIDDKTWMDKKFREQSEFIVCFLPKKVDESEKKKITEKLGCGIKGIKRVFVILTIEWFIWNQSTPILNLILFPLTRKSATSNCSLPMLLLNV